MHGEGGHRNEILSVVSLWCSAAGLAFSSWMGCVAQCTLCMQHAEVQHAEMHRADIPAVVQDFHPTDVNRLVSAGMDNCIKIWSLKGAFPLLHEKSKST